MGLYINVSDIYVRIYYTVIVQGWKLLISHKKVVGEDSPKHCLDFNVKSNEDMVTFLKYFLDENQVLVVAEVKVSILFFQNTLLGMCPYMVVTDLPQIINNINHLLLIILEACDTAENNVKNVVFVNEYTNCISCETKQNMMKIVEHLDGNVNQLFLPDTNNNIKMLRYHIGGKYSPAFFQYYLFDLWLLNLTEGATK